MKWKYIDVSSLVHLPQLQAAKVLGIPSSTLSKRWKEATGNRSWPHKILLKIDKRLTLLSQNAQLYGANVPQETRQEMESLIKQRMEETRPVLIRHSMEIGNLMEDSAASDNVHQYD